MKTTSPASETDFIEPPEELQFVSWPLRDDGAAGWLFLFLALLVPTVIGITTGDTTSALVGWLLVVVAMWRMWIPVTIQLGPRGVFETVLGRCRRIPWTAVKQWKIRRNGLLLLLSDHPAPVVRLWGIHVRFGKEKEQLIQLVRYYAGNGRSSHVANTDNTITESSDTASVAGIQED